MNNLIPVLSKARVRERRDEINNPGYTGAWGLMGWGKGVGSKQWDLSSPKGNTPDVSQL